MTPQLFVKMWLFVGIQNSMESPDVRKKLEDDKTKKGSIVHFNSLSDKLFIPSFTFFVKNSIKIK